MRRRRWKSVEGPGPELPVTPMLDMAFQLLAFFIMVYNPSDLEGVMSLNLPAAGRNRADTPENVDPTAASDKELELPSELTVFVKANHEAATAGTISQIVLDLRQGKVVVDYDPDLKGLSTKLAELRADLSNKDDIKIEAEAALKWKNVVKVMDACRRAEFKNIGFGPPPQAQ
jgi:biopolymer transport protein ExbD